MSRHKRVVVIPMKESNQRLPGKNVKLLGGNPLYQWCLSTLCEVDIDHIFLDIMGPSLLAKVIADLMQLYADGTIDNDAPEITVLPRRAEYCDELLGGDKLLEPFVALPDAVYMQAHVTSPFVDPMSYAMAFDMFDENEDLECVASVTQLQQRAWCNGVPLNFNVYGPVVRTQDLSPIDMENGAFFVFRGSYYLKEKKRFGTSRTQGFMALEYPETIDIDTPEDFEEAERYVEDMVGDGDDGMGTDFIEMDRMTGEE